MNTPSDRNDPLRYQGADAHAGASGHDDELALLRLRYKAPGGERSKLIETSLARNAIQPEASARLRFAAAVAAYADLLRGGANVGTGFDWNSVHALAAGALGPDASGRRHEFLELVDRARAVTGGAPAVAVSE